MNVQNQSSKYLNRQEASDWLKSLGLPIEPTTLQKMASVGGGPAYRRFGRWAVYTESDLLEWAETRMGEPRKSTSGV